MYHCPRPNRFNCTTFRANIKQTLCTSVTHQYIVPNARCCTSRHHFHSNSYLYKYTAPLLKVNNAARAGYKIFSIKLLLTLLYVFAFCLWMFTNYTYEYLNIYNTFMCVAVGDLTEHTEKHDLLFYTSGNQHQP